MLNETEKDLLIKSLIATYEVLGQAATPAAINFMVDDLSNYAVEQIDKSLARCRREVKGRFNLAEIINRIDEDDGTLLANEAWALACHLKRECESGAVTKEILGAMEVASCCPDDIAGRMAFIERYKRLVQQTKDAGEKTEWFMSLGTDKQRRAEAVERAVTAGLITQKKANHLIPDLRQPETDMTKLIEGAVDASKTNPVAKKALAGLRELLKPKTKTKSKTWQQQDLSDVEKELIAHYEQRS